MSSRPGEIPPGMADDSKTTADLPPPASPRARAILLAGFVVFVLALVYLVLASLTRRTAPVFAPSVPGRPVRPADHAGTAVDTLTVQAQREDQWTYVDLDAGVVLMPGDSAGWDVAAQRFRLRAARSVRDLGPGPAVRSGSASGPDPSPGRDFGRWYSYSMLSHLLLSAGHRYAVGTDQGRTMWVEVLSYYCPGLETGCVTLRARPAGGSTGSTSPPSAAAAPADSPPDTRTPRPPPR